MVHYTGIIIVFVELIIRSSTDEVACLSLAPVRVQLMTMITLTGS